MRWNLSTDMRNEFARARAEFYAQLDYEQDQDAASWAEANFSHVNEVMTLAHEYSYEERLAHSVISELNDLANLYQTGTMSEDRDAKILAAQMKELANKIGNRYG